MQYYTNIYNCIVEIQDYTNATENESENGNEYENENESTTVDKKQIKNLSFLGGGRAYS